ncbi:MAG: signal recognition particle protein [Clostridia bacterium]
MFENLSDKLQDIVKKMKGETRITEKQLNEMMREVKLALLEADVNYKVVKEFIAVVSEKALGQDVLDSLTPGQQVVKIVKDELQHLLGDGEAKLNISSNPPTVIMLVGLQGAGKTTLCGKLSNYLRKQGKKPLMVACDVYRPAAIKQLEVVGNSLNIPVYSEIDNKDVKQIAINAIKEAKIKLNDVVILDTAGRLHIDENLMEELTEVKKIAKPHEILLVVDSMTGQDAVNVAESFNNKLGIDGVVMTKLDGDSRGGAALSVKQVTKKPIKFASVGEKMSDLEVFHPDRIASRILGMGDMLGMIEKAEEAFDEKQAIDLENKIRKNKFTLTDYLDQMNKVKKMGSIKQLMKLVPGLPKEVQNAEIDETKLDKVEAIIKSMTTEEREDPKLLNASRRIRIAKGCGQKVEDVNRFMKQFEEMQKVMKSVMNGKNPFGKMPMPKNFKQF